MFDIIYYTICFLIVLNIILNIIISRDSNIYLNSLGILLKLCGLQILISKDKIRRRKKILNSFVLYSIGCIMMICEYLELKIIYMLISEIGSLIFSIIGVYNWYWSKKYRKSEYVHCVIFFFTFCMVFGFSMSFLNIFHELPENEETVDKKNKLLHITLITLAIYPLILLSIRFFIGWIFMFFCLCVSIIINVILNKYKFIYINEATILISLLTLFIYYPKRRHIEISNILINESHNENRVV